MCNCLSRLVPEIHKHVAGAWINQRPTNNSILRSPWLCSWRKTPVCTSLEKLTLTSISHICLYTDHNLHPSVVGNSMSSPCDPGRNTVANIKCGEAGQIMVANKVVNKYSGHQNNCGEAGQIVVANQVVNKYSGHQCECFTSLVGQYFLPHFPTILRNSVPLSWPTSMSLLMIPNTAVQIVEAAIFFLMNTSVT